MKRKTEDIKDIKKPVSEVSLQNRITQVEKIRIGERNKGVVAKLLLARALRKHKQSDSFRVSLGKKRFLN